HLGRFRMEILEYAAQEFAKDQRVHQRGFVFCFDGVPDGVQRYVPPVDLIREVDFIRAAAIVVGAASTDGKAERHGLQRSGLISRNLETFYLRRNGDAVVTDGEG